MAKKADESPSFDSVIASLKKEHSDELFVAVTDPVRLPTRFLRLGQVLGSAKNGLGLPTGCLYEFYGPEGGYKTTACLTILADIARACPKKRVVYLDHENSLTEDYAHALGVMDAVGRPFKEWVLQPSWFEMGAAAAISLVKTGEVSAVVLDSLAALSTKVEMEKGMEGATIGRKAYEIGRFVSQMAPLLRRTGTILLCVNQLRVKIGQMFGDPEKTPGGRALKHAAHIRIRVSPTKVKDHDDLKDVTFSFKKNKITGKYPKVIYRATRDRGFDFSNEALDLAMRNDLVTREPGKDGRGFVFPGGKHCYKTKVKAAEAAEKGRAALLKLSQQRLQGLADAEDAARAKAQASE